MKWFKHDTSALSDAKIEKVIMKYGIEGYGLYFACLEIIAGNLSNENITFELEHDAEILAYKFKIDSNKIEEMMKYFVNLGLFSINEINGRITCVKLANRVDSSLIKNPQLLRIKKGIQEDSRRFEIAQENASQIRLDKIRIEKKEESRFAPPSIEELQKHLDENNIKCFTALQFIDFYSSKGWMIGKNKMKDWRAAVRTWQRRHNEKHNDGYTEL